MKNDNLYIIYFDNGDQMDFNYYWARDEEEAKEAHVDEMAGGDLDLIDDKEFYNNEISKIDTICHVKEAILKIDVANMIDRYLVKPLKK